MPFSEEHQGILKRLVERGILILQDKRIDAGIDLKALGLVNGREAKFLGMPCLVLHGLTDRGFDHILATDRGLVTTPESSDDSGNAEK